MCARAAGAHDSSDTSRGSIRLRCLTTVWTRSAAAADAGTSQHHPAVDMVSVYAVGRYHSEFKTEQRYRSVLFSFVSFRFVFLAKTLVWKFQYFIACSASCMKVTDENFIRSVACTIWSSRWSADSGLSRTDEAAEFTKLVVWRPLIRAPETVVDRLLRWWRAT